MKVPLISGRFFNDQDNQGAMNVMIIAENMARAYWPGVDPVGKRLKQGGAASL